MQNKNILHIVTVSFVINHFFGHQFNYLKKITGNHYFLGCSPSKEFTELSHTLGYEPFEVEVTRNISPITDLKSIWKIYRFIKKNKINTVVGHTPKGGMVAMIASRLAGVNNRIYFRHGIIYETNVGLKRFLLQSIDKISGNLATKVVCVSKSVKKLSENDNLNAAHKNVILGLGTCNGIDTENKFNPLSYENTDIINLKKTLKINQDDFVIGYVGRLVRDKGINELIDAWIILRKAHTNIKLLLVGPFEERDPISPINKQIILTDSSIISTGFILNASKYFKLMDVFVLPTYREGFPTVSLEASSMEIPVLITKATGCQESIIENETGVFITNEPQDIAAKIECYIMNSHLKEKQGKAGREFVRNNFEQTKVWNLINEQLGY